MTEAAGLVSLDLDLLLGVEGARDVLKRIANLDQHPDGPVVLGWRGGFYVVMGLMLGEGEFIAVVQPVPAEDVDLRGLVSLDEAA